MYRSTADRGRIYNHPRSLCNKPAFVWSAWPRNAVFPALFSKHQVPAEKTEIYSGGARGSTFVRCCPDQYSSWPTDRKILCEVSADEPRRSVSTPDA